MMVFWSAPARVGTAMSSARKVPVAAFRHLNWEEPVTTLIWSLRTSSCRPALTAKRLYAESSMGATAEMGDVAAIKPPCIDGSHAQMSATEPRRVLYQVDGCLLGDFDDCYGVVFHRFAGFDPQTSKMLFSAYSIRLEPILKTSPNGKLIMEPNGPQVHFFRLP